MRYSKGVWWEGEVKIGRDIWIRLGERNTQAEGRIVVVRIFVCDARFDTSTCGEVERYGDAVFRLGDVCNA